MDKRLCGFVGFSLVFAGGLTLWAIGLVSSGLFTPASAWAWFLGADAALGIGGLILFYGSF
jgi:hypothetical protein